MGSRHEEAIGRGLTFEQVLITQSSAGLRVLKAAVVGNVVRLHALVVGVDADGTITIEDSAGTDLSGAIPICGGDSNPMVIPFTADPKGCLKTAEGKGLSILTVTSKAFGYAIISSGDL